MSNHDPLQTLVETFGALADEVQGLIDVKTILQHKLAYAHEQVRFANLPSRPSRDEQPLALDLELLS
jgi:hypothetical protein